MRKKILLASLCVFFNMQAQTLKPRYEITGTNSGCTGTEVTFNNISEFSEHEIDYIKWDFGDGSTHISSTFEPTVTHTFNIPGKFQVYLEIKDAVSSSRWTGVSGTDTIWVKISEKPVIDFSFPENQLVCSEGGTAQGDGSSTYSPSENRIEIYRWTTDEGGSPMFGKIRQIPFYQNGYRNVTLTVTDEYGCQNSLTKNSIVYVSAIEPNFYTSDGPSDTTCIYNEFNNKAITLYNASTGQDGFNCDSTLWEFPEGFKLNVSDKEISLTYNTEGEKTVTATLHNYVDFNIGGENFTELCAVNEDIPFYVQKPVADFEASESWVCNFPQEDILLTALHQAPGSTWNWEITNELGNIMDTYSGKNITHTFDSENEIYVNLGIITKYGCKDNITFREAFESRHAEINLTTDEEENGSKCSPLLVNFTGELDPVKDDQGNPVGNTMEWKYVFERQEPYVSPAEYNFLDERVLSHPGINSTETDFSFDQWGNYQIKLIIDNDVCGKDSTQIEVMAGDSNIYIDLHYTPDTCFIHEIPFIDLSYGAGIEPPTLDDLKEDKKISKFGWNVTLKYGDGLSDDNMIEYIHGYLQQGPSAENENYPGNQIDLFQPTKYLPGDYEVVMIVDHYGCIDSASFSLTLKGPFAHFVDGRIQGCEDNDQSHTYIFDIAIFDADEIQIYWGDGQDTTITFPGVIESDTITVDHFYPNVVEYVEDFYLVAFNSTSTISCTDTAKFSGDIYGNDVFEFCVDDTPTASFLLVEDTICYNDPFHVQSNSSANTKIYEWAAKDIISEEGPEVLGEEAFLSPHVRGVFEITLTARTCNLCPSEAVDTGYALQPHADFEAVRTGICPGEEVTFTYSDDPGLSPRTYNDRWDWSFGNGNNETVTSDDPVTHTYGADKTDHNFSPSLTITDAKGCINSIAKNDYIKSHIPNPSTQVTQSKPNKICNETESISVTSFDANNKSGVGLQSVILDMGDGTAPQNRPVQTSGLLNYGRVTGYRYNFSDPQGWNHKSVTITATLTDDNGCEKTVAYPHQQIVYERPDMFTFDTVPGALGTSCYPTSITTKLDFYQSASDTVRRVYYMSENNLGTKPFSGLGHIDSITNLQLFLPGEHDISIFVQSVNGCHSDTIKEVDFIDIPGPYAEFEVFTGTSPITPYELFACRKQPLFFSITEYLNLSHGYRWHFDMNTADHSDRSAASVSDIHYDVSEYGVYSYNTSGDKFVQLELLSDDPACVRWAPRPEDNAMQSIEDYFYQEIYIKPLNAFFAPADSACGKNDTIIFTMKDPEHVSESFWVFHHNTTTDTLGLNSDTLILDNFPDYGNYSVSLYTRDMDGCEDMETFPFTVHRLPDNTIIRGDTTICYGGQAQLSMISHHNYRYTWDPPQNLNITNIHNPIASPRNTTTFSTNIYDDSTTCTSDTNITVRVQDVPSIIFFEINKNTGDTIPLPNDYAFLAIGDTLYVLAYHHQDPNVDVFWEYNGTDSLGNLAILYPNATTHYTVIAKDSTVYLYGCHPATGELEVEVSEGSVDVPKAFSPNGDGINDIIYVKGWGIHLIDQFEFTIYNRWGQMVFKTNNIHEGWDGMYKGKLQGVDTYTYNIRVTYQDGNVMTKSGAFTLLQ
jgi:gliding motility-associated-like protein